MSQNPPPKRTLESLPDAAARYSVHPRTLRRMISDGVLPGYRLGPRCLRVDPDEVDALFRPIPTVARAS